MAFDATTAKKKLGKWSANDSKQLEDAGYSAHPDKERSTYGAGKIKKSDGSQLNKSGERIMHGYRETQFKHRSPSSGGYTVAREKLHDKIISNALAGHKPHSVPQVVFTAGGAASGKSLTIGKAAPPDPVFISTDNIAEDLPEYHGLLATGNAPMASAACHGEVCHIAKRMTNEAMTRGLNVVIDGDGGGKKFPALVQKAKDHGYDTTVAFVHAPIKKAIEREAKRAEQRGTIIHLDPLVQSHIDSSKNFVPITRLHGVHVKVFNNTGSSLKPPLIASGVGGKRSTAGMKVLDTKAYNAFRAKAHDKPENYHG